MTLSLFEKTSLESYILTVLKGNIQTKEYYRALKACLEVVSESTDITKSFVLSWKAKYGAAIVKTQTECDPLIATVFVIGLDQWEFTIDQERNNNAIFEGEPSLALVGNLPIEDFHTFIDDVNNLLSKAESAKKENAKRDIQHTPGFLRAKCIEVLEGLSCTRIEEGSFFHEDIIMNKCEISKDRSGFTDVGSHTGCRKRDASSALLQAVLKAKLKFGMFPKLVNYSLWYTKLISEYNLGLACKLVDSMPMLTSKSYKSPINSIMSHLTAIERLICPLSDYDYFDDLFKPILSECEVIRKKIEKITYDQAHTDAQKYQIFSPNLRNNENSHSFTLEKVSASKTNEISWEKIVQISKANLLWLPVKDIGSLKDCDTLLKDTSFSVTSYSFSIIFNSVEMYLLSLGKSNLHLKPDFIEIDASLLINVCDSYRIKLNSFMQSKPAGILLKELLSHKVLVTWLQFCLLFKMALNEYPLISKYKVPLNYEDLEHLIIKDKWAWEMLDIISVFLKENSKNGVDAIFSDKNCEMEGTLHFANEYVLQDNIYESFYQQTNKIAEERIEKRWKEILVKQKKCKWNRERILQLEEEIRIKKNELSVDLSYYEYNRIDNQIKNLKNSVRGETLHLEINQKCSHLILAIPRETNACKTELFFVYMPNLLFWLFETSYKAQKSIFKGESYPKSPQDTTELISFYKQQFQSKFSGYQSAPLYLFVEKPPNSFGQNNVECISNRYDGVWYVDFRAKVRYSYDVNPFKFKRIDAVKDFCEIPIDKKLENLHWMLYQSGYQSSKCRGNVSISSLKYKPISMSRDQYLSLGNLRAFPCLQIFHLLDSIKQGSLPFSKEYYELTHNITRQVFYHIGQIKENSLGVLVKEWKIGIEPLDSNFLSSFREVLASALDRLQDASKNEYELMIVNEIISFLSQFDRTFDELMDRSCSIGEIWAENMEMELVALTERESKELKSDVSYIQKKKHRFYLYSLLSYEMIEPNILTDTRIQKMVELVLKINRSKPETLDVEATNLLSRIYFFMSRTLLPFRESNIQWNTVLTTAVKKIVPSYIDDNMEWECLEKSFCWISKNKNGEYISLNIMNGVVLVNGVPLLRLPLHIRNSPLFKRVFGYMNFEVTMNKDGSFKLSKPFKCRDYTFSMEGDALIVKEYYKEETLELLECKPDSSWTRNIPIGLLNLYSHWHSDKYMVILFRPLNFRKTLTYYILTPNGLYKIPPERRRVTETSLHNICQTYSKYDRYFVLDSNAKRCIDCFTKFDKDEYIHTYVSNNNTFKVYLARYRLTFEFKEEFAEYECSELGKYKLSSFQQFNDMLYGFDNYLIMEKQGTSKIVILPKGKVDFKKVSIVVGNEIIDDVSEEPKQYNKFTIHPLFLQLQATDILSGLQLACVYAACSSYLPEENSKMTGYENCVDQLRKCWINRPLSIEETETIECLFSLKDEDFPSVIYILAHQLIMSTSKLSFLYKNDIPRLSCDIYNKYFTAVNEYHLRPHIHLFPRNYRLCLSEAESHTFFGTDMPSKHLIYLNISPRLNMKSDSFKCKIQDVQKYENEFNGFINFLDQEKRTTSFPLSGFQEHIGKVSKSISTHMLKELKDSFEKYQTILRPELNSPVDSILNSLKSLHAKINLEMDEIYVYIMQKVNNNHKDILKLLKASNGIPILTKMDIIQASFNPQILLEFNPFLSHESINSLFYVIIDWMQYQVLNDKVTRVQNFLETNSIDFAIQELLVKRVYDPYKHPEWLAFEIDQGLQIRQEQLSIIESMLKNENSVAQLNMGLGKTRVIVPCLMLEYARQNKIPRVYFLSSLLDEGFDYLHRTLTGGVFKKKLFRYPFNRDAQLDNKKAAVLLGNMKYCLKVDGAAILAPEYSLSMFLKSFEIQLNSSESKISNIMDEIDKLPFVNIYDEVDEIMRPNQELIYAEGSPILLPDGSRRWGAIFSLLLHIRYSPDIRTFLEAKKIMDFKNDCSIDQYNGIRLLPGATLQKEIKELNEKIAKSLFHKVNNDYETTLDWLQHLKKETAIKNIILFITDTRKSKEIIDKRIFLHPDEYFQDLLVLRGLLAYGILTHCLTLRPDVNYGVVPNHKTAMAIPFAAAKNPKLRSEFAQPECAIILTVLSYYNIGLSRNQIIETFSSLLSCGPSYQKKVYDGFFNLLKLRNETYEYLHSINSINKIDVTNEVQVDLLHNVYSLNILVINYWLSNVLFPESTMIFPGKLMASSWNLTDSQKTKLQCGFSGTNDSCLLLPYPINYKSANVLSIQATNGKMIEYLCNKAEYYSLPINSSVTEIEDILASLVLEKDVDALIDAGALLNNSTNEIVADIFLKKFIESNTNKFKGVVYYSIEKHSWRVKNLNNFDCSLSTSPILERDAFVIYDQNRCRGADMKLRPNAKAFLSLGQQQTKDSLMQAAGRLRQLDFGQSLIVIATKDVETLIKDSANVKDKVTMKDVLFYVFLNSINYFETALKHWSSQGLHFLNCLDCSSNVRQDEICNLEMLYGSHDSDIPETIKDIVFSKLDNYCNSSVTQLLRKRSKKFGFDSTCNVTANFNECERELEQERELEIEKDVEYPDVNPLKENDWNYGDIFRVESVKDIPNITLYSIPSFIDEFLSDGAIDECLSVNWKAGKVYMTNNFCIPLVRESDVFFDEFLRPIRIFLFFPKNQEILLISERECENLWNFMSKEKKHENGPILIAIRFTDSTIRQVNTNYCIGDLVSSFANIDSVSFALINFFNGQTCFSKESQNALKTILLLNKESLSASKYFCNHRGYRVMFHGSDLEKVVNEKYQDLHDETTNSSLNKE